jgi:hypothetical protein
MSLSTHVATPPAGLCQRTGIGRCALMQEVGRLLAMNRADVAELERTILRTRHFFARERAKKRDEQEQENWHCG